MKNKIKYLNELTDILTSIDMNDKVCDFVQAHIFHLDNRECPVSCKECMMTFRKWLEEEYIEFTEEELVILKNIDKGYNYISRNNAGNLEVTDTLSEDCSFWESFRMYNHIFRGIKPGQTVKIEDYLPLKEDQNEYDLT